MSEHKDYTRGILALLEQLGPDNEQLHHIYSIGFLASYIASKCEQDPYVYKEFVRLVNSRKD